MTLSRSLWIAITLSVLVGCIKSVVRIPIPEPMELPPIENTLDCLSDEAFGELRRREDIAVANYNRLRRIVEAHNAD